ncbi:MAG: flagellar type III secretion system pore protein FliP [Hyphomicrobiales bacterium]|nr:flagellar type III secretion system pore protein FliP [Hyphomicrobiales bacterium]
MKLAIALVLLLAAGDAAAQTLGLGDLGKPGPLVSGRIIQIVAVLSALSIAPSLLVMLTSFTRIVVALSFLRSGLGLQSTPANIIMVSLALFMTFHVMEPTFEKAYADGVTPLMEAKIDEKEAFSRIVEPFRAFMMKNVRDKDLRTMEELAARGTTPAPTDKPELRNLIPAFMMSELRRGFEIGFLIALPFLVIDMIVATLTMSMGMMMMPPTVIALPIKVLFFILMDGWNLLVASVIRSYS